MRPNTFGLHFIVRSNRMDANSYVPIYAKVILNNQILKLSINQKVKKENWIIKEERAKNKTDFFEEINSTIEAYKSKIYLAYSKLIATNAELTIENLKNEILGKNNLPRQHTLIETFTEHNKYFESMIGVKYSYGSYKNYKTTLKYLVEFVPQFKKKKDIALSEVDYKFCEAFFKFLTTTKTCNINGANKQMQRVKKVLNEAIRKGLINNNPMASYKLEFEPVNKIALTIDEIKKLEAINFNRKTLEIVRDIFILQCYTGLAYADVKLLTSNNIFKDSKNGLWIKMSRQKTKISFAIPLLQQAINVLTKYKMIDADELQKLPVLSNQKMNDSLKIIQEIANINKSLTTHLARHSFATTITLSNGIPIETVSKMLGHTKLSTTQVYAKVNEQKIESDMSKLIGKL